MPILFLIFFYTNHICYDSDTHTREYLGSILTEAKGSN
jgi:hypothetical protein